MIKVTYIGDLQLECTLVLQYPYHAMDITRVYEKVFDVLVTKNFLTPEYEHKHSMTRIQTYR